MTFCLSKENTQEAEILRTKQNESVPDQGGLFSVRVAES